VLEVMLQRWEELCGYRRRRGGAPPGAELLSSVNQMNRDVK
jgi:hypothetical protein